MAGRTARRTFFWTNRILNPILERVLSSRFGGRPGRRLALLHYLGARSGRPRRVITQYERTEGGIVVRVGAPDAKRWWRNFRTPHPVQVRVAGQDHDAMGHVVDGDPVRVELRW